VEGVDSDQVRLRQDLRNTAGWWFYWAFRVSGAAGRTLRFEFTDGDPLGVRGPAVSTDAGATWRWLGRERADVPIFSYAFPPDAGEVRFAYGIPYLQPDWERFLGRHRDNPRLTPGTLCASRHGRPVESLVVEPRAGPPRRRVLLTARHHACEAMANFVLEGLLDAVLVAGTGKTRWLAENVAFLVVPFVDKDGVEDGDQGKNRQPRDHGRDYLDASIHPETTALRRMAPAWADGQLAAFLDLHCPWIHGGRNERIFIVGSPDAHIWREQQRFGAILESLRRGPLPYRAQDNLPFGQEWNVAVSPTEGLPPPQWAAETLHAPLAMTVEFPYANAGGAEVLPEGARAFGADLARTLDRWLQAP
jgi:hypothetical protein